MPTSLTSKNPFPASRVSDLAPRRHSASRVLHGIVGLALLVGWRFSLLAADPPAPPHPQPTRPPAFENSTPTKPRPAPAASASPAAESPAAKRERSFGIARQHRQQGRPDEALEAYAALEKEGADGVRIALGRSEVLADQGKLSAAVDALAAAAGTKPAPPLLARWAELLLQQGKFSECEKKVTQALQGEADLPLARLVQGDLFTATGRLEKADEAYHWFIGWYNRAQPEDAERLLLVGGGAAQYGRWRRVNDIFDFIVNTLCPDALKADPNCWQAHCLAGSLLLEKYNRGQAIPEFESALKINPRAADALAGLALAAQQEQDLETARQRAEQILKINPQHSTALHILADLLLDEGKDAAALQKLEIAREENPHSEKTLARIAAAYLLLDGPPNADDLNSLLLQIDKINELKLPQPTRFTNLVSFVAKFNPHPGEFCALLGAQLESRRKFDLAERFYKQAILSFPQFAPAHTALGMLYMRVGKTDQARQILDAAFDADPFHVRVSNMRKVLKVLEGYATIASDHFVIRADGKADKILAKYMSEYLEEQYPGLVKQFGYEPATRTQFEIYNNAKGLSAHEWFSARMVGLPWIQTIGASTGMIVALASPTAAEKPFNWARVLKHEFVHILTLQQTNFNIPHWYTEALAVLNEGYPRPEMWNQLLLRRVPAGDVMNLDNINQGFTRPKTPEDWHMAYCQSLLYAQYLLKTQGPQSTSQLLDAYRRNLTTEQALRELFGIEKQAFEQGYRKYLQEVTAELRGDVAEKVFSPAEMERAYKAHPEDHRAAGRYARFLFSTGQRKQARDIARKIREKQPADPLAALVLAELALRGEDEEEALKFLEAGLDRNKPHAELLELLAKTELARGKFDRAAELYRLGSEKFPGRIDWLKGQASVSLKAGKPRELQPLLRQLAALDADDAVVRKKLTRLEFDQGHFSEAIKYARETLQIDVLDVEIHTMLARAYAAEKDLAKSVTEWEIAVELAPQEDAHRTELIRALQGANRPNDALLAAQAWLKTQPENAQAKAMVKSLKKP